MSASQQKKPNFEDMTTQLILGAEVVFNHNGHVTGTYLCPKCHIPMRTKDITQGVRCPDCGHSVTFEKICLIRETFPKVP
jgi:DNA-directed RNA polymerase subunit RPC12/RpoP